MESHTNTIHVSTMIDDYSRKHGRMLPRTSVIVEANFCKRLRDLPTDILGVRLIEGDKHFDERGFFSQVFSDEDFRDIGIAMNVVLANTSYSAKAGTLRGMHYQNPFEQAKVIRCIRGAIYDVMLDMRLYSHTFGHYFGAQLTADNGNMMYAPKGFAHGFMTLADNTEVLYFCDDKYSPGNERIIRYDDPRFNIVWPMEPTAISEKDSAKCPA